MIAVTCPECDADLKVSNGKAGQKLRCPDCGAPIDVPRRVPRGVGAGLWTLFAGVWSLALVLVLALLVEGRDEGPPETPSGPSVADRGNTGEAFVPPQTAKSTPATGSSLPPSANIPALILGLRAADPEYRVGCAARLGSEGKAAGSAAPALTHCLNDKEERVRRAALEALHAIKEPPTRVDAPDLVEALTSSDPEVRLYSAAALGQIGPDARGDASAALILATKDPDHPALRRQAYLALGRVTPSDRALLFPVIVAGSTDKHLEVRAAALHLLLGLDPPTATDVPALAAALNAPNPQVRVHAAGCLVRLGPAARGAVKELDKALTRPDKQTAALAARALARIGADGRIAGPNLLKAAEDESDALAAAAANALITLGLVTKKDVPHYITLLRDSRAHTRLTAILLVRKLGADAIDAAPHLVQLLQSDSDKQVRLEAARALAAFAPGYTQAIPVLVSTAKDSDGELRQAVVATLGSYGTEAHEAIPVLEGFFKITDDRPLLGETVTALAAISPDVRTARELDGLVLVPDNKDLRGRVFIALAKIGKPAIPVLGELLNNNDRDLRLQSATALGTIGPDVRNNVLVLRYLAVHAGQMDAKIGDTDAEVKRACKNALDKINSK